MSSQPVKKRKGPMIDPYSESTEKPTVLVVDDSSDNIEILAKILHPEYRVLFSTDGRQACILAEKQSPDLILLDVEMPEMDGYSVCKELKSNPLLMDIPVIFVTAHGEEHFEMTGFDVGGVDYITKPVKPFIVKARVKTHIELKRKNDFFRGISLIDGLTGIANRRRFDDFIEHEWVRGTRSSDSWLSLILLDVDFFKYFNDGYGHQKGDDCLKAIASAIRGSLKRNIDLAARYGGEEFVCVLPETPSAGGIKLAERIQRNIAALKIPHEFSSVSDFVTVSIGLSSMLPKSGQGYSVIIEAADRLLYEAKRAGRNQIKSSFTC